MCMTYDDAPGSFTVMIDMEINRLSVAFNPLTTSMTGPGATKTSIYNNIIRVCQHL